MDSLVYIRYNPTKDGKEPKILESIILEYKEKGEIYKKAVNYTKKLSKKEIKEIQELVKQKNVKRLYIYNVDQDKNFYLLKDLLNIDIEVLSKNQSKEISKKLQILLDVLKFIAKKEIVNNDELYEEIKRLNFKYKIDKKISKVTITNYIRDLKELHFIEKLNSNYKIKDSEVIIKEILKKVDDIGYITDILLSLDDKIMRDLSLSTKKLLNINKEFIIYKQRPFEDLDDIKFEFEQFKKALKEKKVIKYIIKGNNKKDKNIVPISLVFMENNWYLAGLINGNVSMYRLNFIYDFEVSNEIYTKDLTKYIEFIKYKMQTPFTKYNTPFKPAKLKIDKNYKHYFDKKEHFPYQEKDKEDENGNLIINIKYTQPLEVLPTIKKWLPNIQILESENNELQKLLIKDLEKSLNLHK